VASLAEAIGVAQRALDGSTEAARTSDLPGPVVRCEPTRVTAEVTAPCAEPTTMHGLSGQFRFFGVQPSARGT
jgi:hypothetical protein